MRTVRLTLLSCFLILFATSCFSADGQYPKAPLNQRVVAALVAGGSLPESIAVDIRDCGLTFRPDEQYLSRLQKSGATPMVLDALRHAKVSKNATRGQLPTDAGVLNSILAAGEKLQINKVMDAAKEIASSNVNIEEYPELAFVMGEIIRIENGPAQSAAIYEKLADLCPEFPEVHTKLSFAIYKLDDYERGLQEAMAALARTPSNAEAHKNKGLNLEGLGNYDAAIGEYQQALLLKPDYQKVRYDLGLLYYNRKDYRNSIEQYSKALILDPTDGNAHYNLALAYEMVHEHGSAIEHCRELIRLDPKRMDARMELAELLVETGQKEAGISEFRQLISLSPDSSYCHRCFGRLLYHAIKFDEAEKEYRLAIQLDPTDARSHAGLGTVLAAKKRPDEALAEFLLAGKQGFDSGPLHREIGDIYLQQKKIPDAIREERQAVAETPEDFRAHFILGESLEASGEAKDAIAEYQQSASLVGFATPAAADAEIKAAALLEKSGQGAEALKTYKERYAAFPNEQTKTDYESARRRLSAYDHEAVQPSVNRTPPQKEQSVAVSPAARQADAEADLLPALFEEKYQAMFAAMGEQHWNQALELGNAALAAAEKMVPPDQRLAIAHKNLGQMYVMEHKFSDAEKEYLLELKAAQDVFGPKSFVTSSALVDVGGVYQQQRKFAQALEYFNLALAASEAISPGTGEPILASIGQTYQEQGDFKNAEQAFKKMLAAQEAKDGPGSFMTSTALERLGLLYFEEHDYAQAQGFFERLLAVDEKQFGSNSTMIQTSLDRLATTLRALGKNDEAEKLEHRKQLIAQNQTH